MRIISGEHKGRRIIAPRNLPVRPTTDKAKEALFNMLNNRFDLQAIKALDLFSGIGSISLELGSRGCKQIMAVDRFYKNIGFLKATAEQLALSIHPIKADVFEFLNASTPGKFDVIFADPPYSFKTAELETLIKLIFEKELLLEKGLFVLEHSKHITFNDHSHLEEERRYGSTVFSFFS